MKWKKAAVAVITMVCALSLSACGFHKKSTSNSNYTTTGSAGRNYQGVIEHGHYKVSKARGVNVTQNTNQYNLKSFETGLTEVSKKSFSPKNYIFQEGQYLDTTEVQHLLARKSAKNPEGLNPKKGKSSDPNPEFIQQLEEQDFVQQSGGSLKLKGMTIGIGVNSEYNYQKKKDGPQYTKKISDAEVKRQGEIAAAKVLKQVRQKKGCQNIPIVIALYKQAPDDSLVGGSFFAYEKSSNSSLGDWKDLNYKTTVMPKASGANSTNKENESDDNNFSNFKSQIQSFFPNISGVTAQAQYKNDSLAGMHITVTTQFYSETEIQSFTDYIAQAAKKYLPNGIPIDIRIQSDSEMQAIVFRNAGSDKFQTHVLTSY